jgi:hypothetical protein
MFSQLPLIGTTANPRRSRKVRPFLHNILMPIERCPESSTQLEKAKKGVAN